MKKVLFKIRYIIYICLSFINKPLFRQLEKNQVFILCYHSIASDSWRYGETLETLTNQLTYLVSKYQPITLDDVALILEGKKKIDRPSFVVTFDDGYKEILAARSLVKKLHIKPAFFILATPQKANFKELDTKREFLTKSEITLLIKDGWTLGSHSNTHADFWKLSAEQIQKEVIISRNILSKTYGIKIQYFAYPKGRYTAKVVEAVAKAGYTLGLTVDDGFINQSTHAHLVPRIGVDRTHTNAEFRRLMLPTSILFRQLLKKLPIGGLIS